MSDPGHVRGFSYLWGQGEKEGPALSDAGEGLNRENVDLISGLGHVEMGRPSGHSAAGEVREPL